MAVDGAAVDEAALVAGLRAGDENAFRDLVRRYHAALVRLALVSVASPAVAQEVAQATWLEVIRSIRGFDGRSSLKIWIFRILLDRARQRGVGERRIVPMPPPGEGDAPAVSSGRFVPEGQRWAGHWSVPPVSWTGLPAERLIGEQAAAAVVSALDELPDRQRAVVILRDVEGWIAGEVCALLGVSGANQRVLLHRGRSRMRAGLEDLLRR